MLYTTLLPEVPSRRTPKAKFPRRLAGGVRADQVVVDAVVGGGAEDLDADQVARDRVEDDGGPVGPR